MGIFLMDTATLERLLIREIRRSPGISRRDLADRVDVARSTAGRRVDNLIDNGLVRESGVEHTAEAGRPKRQLELRGDYGTFIGFDFDARNIYGVLVDFAQSSIEEVSIPLTPRPSKDEVINHLRETIDRFRDSGHGTLHGIGIGVPGPIQQAKRLALGYPYIAKWKDVDLCQELDVTSKLLHIEHNTRAMAIGEYWLGSASLVENLICINVRTGISAAIISEGRLIRGTHELAGEIRGWTVSSENNTSPKRVWLEDRATVRAISPDSVTTPEAWNEFVSNCRDGDREALKQLSEIVKHHGDTVARLTQVTDPEMVVFAGSFNDIGDLYLDRVREATAIALLGQFVPPPPIKFVSLGHCTGAHGAAALAAEQFKLA